MQVWLQRWLEGRIGWHEAEGNSSLKKYWQLQDRTVLVPLCGKSVDLRWLAEQGNRVVGVELAEIAVEAFFAEQRLDYTVCDDELRRFDANGVAISIYCGDFFALTSIRCDAHYDRGALIALPPEQRPDYAAHLRTLLTDDAERLVITLNYDQERADGPPYSLEDDELLRYWPELECVASYDDIANAPPKFIEAGLKQFMEKVWRSSRRVVSTAHTAS